MGWPGPCTQLQWQCGRRSVSNRPLWSCSPCPLVIPPRQLVICVFVNRDDTKSFDRTLILVTLQVGGSLKIIIIWQHGNNNPAANSRHYPVCTVSVSSKVWAFKAHWSSAHGTVICLAHFKCPCNYWSILVYIIFFHPEMSTLECLLLYITTSPGASASNCLALADEVLVARTVWMVIDYNLKCLLTICLSS